MDIALTSFELDIVRKALQSIGSSPTAVQVLSKLPPYDANKLQFFVLTTREEYEGRSGEIPEIIQCRCGNRMIARNNKATCQECGSSHEVLPGRRK